MNQRLIWIALSFLSWLGAPAFASPTMDACEKCHTVQGWQFAQFSHDKTNYPLVGSHRIVACKACHTDGDFTRKLSQSCGHCHQDVHAGNLGKLCSKCHDEFGWKGQFTVEAHRRTNFPLTGRHALIPCEECHQSIRDKTFSRAPASCASCHVTEYQSTSLTTIDHAASGFSQNCQECHMPSRWTPTRGFSAHEICFPITRGSHAGIPCESCHQTVRGLTMTGACGTGNYFCGNCHTGAHTQSRMNEEHSDVEGYQYTDRKCYECHHP